MINVFNSNVLSITALAMSSPLVQLTSRMPCYIIFEHNFECKSEKNQMQIDF